MINTRIRKKMWVIVSALIRKSFGFQPKVCFTRKKKKKKRTDQNLDFRYSYAYIQEASKDLIPPYAAFQGFSKH